LKVLTGAVVSKVRLEGAEHEMPRGINCPTV
jgi:hypothetical protein